jgi:hypothetical protein
MVKTPDSLSPGMQCDRCKQFSNVSFPVRIGEQPYTAKVNICRKCWMAWATLMDRQESERSDFILKGVGNGEG